MKKMANVLELKDVNIHFGGVYALKHVSFTMEDGEALALIGPNGAGKSTLFNVLTGIYKPTSGDVIYQGNKINHLPPYKRVRKGIARTFQNPRLIKSMTVLENVLAAHPLCNQESLFRALFAKSTLQKNRQKAYEESMEVLREVGLEDKSEMLASDLSYGQQRLVEIARALVTKCSLLLLDEPAAGMNREEKKHLVKFIKELSRKHHFNIILIEHDINLVVNFADRIIVLSQGEQIAEGNGEQIQNNQDVIDAYLGKGDDDFE